MRWLSKPFHWRPEGASHMPPRTRTSSGAAEGCQLPPPPSWPQPAREAGPGGGFPSHLLIGSKETRNPMMTRLVTSSTNWEPDDSYYEVACVPLDRGGELFACGMSRCTALNASQDGFVQREAHRLEARLVDTGRSPSGKLPPTQIARSRRLAPLVVDRRHTDCQRRKSV